jgi:hypothetical protein
LRSPWNAGEVDQVISLHSFFRGTYCIDGATATALCSIPRRSMSLGLRYWAASPLPRFFQTQAPNLHSHQFHRPQFTSRRGRLWRGAQISCKKLSCNPISSSIIQARGSMCSPGGLLRPHACARLGRANRCLPRVAQCLSLRLGTGELHASPPSSTPASSSATTGLHLSSSKVTLH